MRKSLIFALALTAVPSAFAAEVFSNFPNTLPPNLPSLGYQATQTAEFGNKIGFGGTERSLTSVEVGLSSWAKHSDWTGVGDSTGFDHDLTFNIYNAGSGDSVGSLLGSVTTTVHVLWRPEADNPDGSYTGPDNLHYNGKLFTASFDFSSLNIELPETVIFGLAFNTQTWGYDPIGAGGPYNSLNFALAGAPTVGTDLDANDAYWNTMTPANYADNGAGGVGTFRRDTNWAPYVPMVRFNAAPVPEPASMAVLGLGALALLRRRRAK
jgi:hypothetical protein